MSTGSRAPNSRCRTLTIDPSGHAPAVDERDVRLLHVMSRRGVEDPEPGHALGPCLIAAKDDELGREGLDLLQRLRHARFGSGALHVDVEAVGPRRRRLGPRLQRGQVDPARAEGEERMRQHARTVIQRDDE